MDLNLSEICTMLGDRIEQYNSVAKKRGLETGTTLINTKRAKTETINTPPCQNAVSTPKETTKQSTPAYFASTTEIPIGETPKRWVKRVHKKIIAQPRKLIFYDSDDYDD